MTFQALNPTLPANVQSAAALQSQRQSGTSDLGQNDFLRLMTTQLKNQDPFAPMENGEFLAQMAQFSTVAGLDSVNDTLGAISGQIAGNRIATGASLLGSQVLVPGSLARPDAAGEIHGVVDLPQAVSAVTIGYVDTATGMELHRQVAGPQASGLFGFSWDDLPADLKAARGQVRIQVTAQTADGALSLAPSVYARVTGVELPREGGQIALRLEDYGLQNSVDITALR